MIALFLNGEAPTAKSLPNLNSYSHIMCTDGAYNYLQTLGIKPQYICGDFDSISTDPPAALRQHLPDQNYTDFEKTLQFILANWAKTFMFLAQAAKNKIISLATSRLPRHTVKN